MIYIYNLESVIYQSRILYLQVEMIEPGLLSMTVCGYKSSNSAQDQELNRQLAVASVDPLLTDEPNTYKQAMARPDCDQWKLATRAEMDAIKKSGTWILTVLDIEKATFVRKKVTCDILSEKVAFLVATAAREKETSSKFNAICQKESQLPDKCQLSS